VIGIGHADQARPALGCERRLSRSPRRTQRPPGSEACRRIGDDPAALLRSYARRTKKADANAAEGIAALSKGVLHGLSFSNRSSLSD
jgi:hypothetical protein